MTSDQRERSTARRPGPGVVLALAWSGVRHRPRLWLLLVLGVALSAVLPVLAVGLRTEASVAAVQSAVQGLPPAERSVLAVTSRDLRGTGLSQTDASVRGGLGAAGVADVQSALIFRPTSLAGTDVTVGALGNLPGDVALASGRLPTRCAPTACEVLVVAPPGGGPAPELRAVSRSARALGLLVTGSATLTDARVVGVRLSAPELPLLLGADPAALAELDALSLFGRNTAWLGSLDGAELAARGVDGFSRALAGVADQVNASSGPFTVSWPDEPVTAAAARAESSAGRVTVLGAGAGVLQLGFCLVTAAGLRRSVQLTGRLLTRRGASAAQVLGIAALQPLVAVAAGVVLGAGAALVLVAVRSRPGFGGWRAASTALVDAWPWLVGLGAAAVLLSGVVTSWPARGHRSIGLLLDLALVVTVGATVLLLTGGSGAPGAFAPSVVVLVSVATGLAAARLWVPAVTLGTARGSRPVQQVALVAGRRRPLLARTTAGFLAAACCSVVFASTYRDSLSQSALDLAAQQVPMDVRVTGSPAVAAPLAALDVPRLKAAVPGLAVHPVVSSTVTAFAGSSLAEAVPLTGLDPQVLPRLAGYAATTGSDLPPAELASRLAVTPPPAAAAPLLPAGTERLSLRVAGMNSDITVALWLSSAEGASQHVELARRGSDLVAELPGGPELRVQAVEVVESPSHLTHRLHAVGEGSTDRALAAGRLRFGSVTADGRRVDWSWADWGSDGAEVQQRAGDGLTVRYQVAEAPVVLTPGFVPRQALNPLPVAVDPDTAGRAGPDQTFGITVGALTVPARIVAVLPRMPALDRAFLLADRTAVTALLQRTAPATAAVTQVWLAAPATALPALRRELAAPPDRAPTVAYRSDLEQALARDPVALRSGLLLTATGVLALLLALVGLATAVRADHAQSGAELVALEVEGWSEARVRSVLVHRWLSVLVVGLPLGVAGGWLLSGAGVQTLGTAQPGLDAVPPLRTVLASPTTLGVLATVVIAAVLTCGWAAWAAVRQAPPSRPDRDLE